MTFKPVQLALLSLLCMATACGGGSIATAGPYIPPLAISISPDSATVSVSGTAVFTAHPSGGEAIRLFVDWSIQEGAAGGNIVVQPDGPHGDSSVQYTAPDIGTGTFHIVASIRNFPDVKAVATVNVK
jgi:hypothetical protein